MHTKHADVFEAKSSDPTLTINYRARQEAIPRQQLPNFSSSPVKLKLKLSEND